MLAITPAAVEAVDAITSQPDISDEAALRISTAQAPADAEGQLLELSVVDGPEPGDMRVGAADVFVSEQAAVVLDDKVLDAELDSGQVQFSVRPQAGTNDGAA